MKCENSHYQNGNHSCSPSKSISFGKILSDYCLFYLATEGQNGKSHQKMFRHDISHRFMTYEHHETPQASNPPKKLKKAKKFFEGQIEGHQPISSNFEIFFGFLGPFGSQNSAIAIFLTSKAIKAKKATKRPNITNFSCGKVLGPKMVSQGPKQSYEVI